MEGGLLLYKQESYDLIGCAFRVFNEMGYGHHERNYQRGYAIELEQIGYQYKREVYLPVLYKGQTVSKYFLDFLVNETIVVELKVANDFHPYYTKQVLTYLTQTNKRLGLLILFTAEGIKYRRIVN